MGDISQENKWERRRGENQEHDQSFNVLLSVRGERNMRGFGLEKTHQRGGEDMRGGRLRGLIERESTPQKRQGERERAREIGNERESARDSGGERERVRKRAREQPSKGNQTREKERKNEVVRVTESERTSSENRRERETKSEYMETQKHTRTHTPYTQISRTVIGNMITSLSDGRERISLSQSGGRDTASGKENGTEDGAQSYKSNDECLSCANWKSRREREIEKFIIRQPPKGEKDDYDSENSWISDGLPSSSRRRRRGDGR
jgi:hypothetical protein